MANGTTTIPAVASKGKWSNLSKYACRIYFFLVILQVPLFSSGSNGLICIGAVVSGLFKAYCGLFSPSDAEAIARREGLMFAREFELDIECDVLQVIKDVQGANRWAANTLIIIDIVAVLRDVGGGTSRYTPVRGMKWLIKVPCRSGMCTTPLQVTSSQLIASEIFPVPVVKGLLYPGAVVNGLINNMTIPSWENLLSIYNLTDIKEASAVADLQRLEVLAGSYFSVAGALIGILKPGRMSMFGTLLIIWGLVKEGILKKPAKPDPTNAVFVYPTMLIALVCALLSVKYDVKKAVRSAAARPVAKPMLSSSKSKLK